MSGLAIRVEGKVAGKSSGNGRTGPYFKAAVVYEGGRVNCKFPGRKEYDEFPAEGEPVVAYFGGEVITGEYGQRIERLAFVRSETPGGPAASRRV